MVTEARVREVLAAVKDPEIPTCSITDLGIVERVRVAADAVEVDLLPTFVGCPALDVIREDVRRALEDLEPAASIKVRFVMSPPWTTDRLTEAGKEALEAYGIARPVLQVGRRVRCPYCGSESTHQESAFGPTPCRTVRYCDACRNPFEGFKVKG